MKQHSYDMTLCAMKNPQTLSKTCTWLLVSAVTIAIFSLLPTSIATAAEYAKIESCYDLDRSFKVCPENQGVDIYRTQVAAAHAEGKSALIVYGYDSCPWCVRVVTMFYSSPIMAEIRSKTKLLPISSRTQTRTHEGNAVFRRNETGRAYFQSIGVDPGDTGVPQLYLVRPDGSVFTLIEDLEDLERNYRFHREDADGNLRMKKDGSRPLRYRYQGYDLESLFSILSDQLAR